VSDEALSAECCRCGARQDLVEDANVPGCTPAASCLDRVASQNERIREGLEDEPEAEL
jgi:hypothetical protein